jgi:NAD(P)-dependent dehydrogenase (short-subunit alcohol dehydrogenase family)
MTKSNGNAALITDSTDGVGRVVAKRLADGGWRVLVHGRDRGRGEALVADIKSAGGTAEFLQADLSSIAEVRRLADAVQKTTRRLDLLINNAGLGSGVSRTARKTSVDGYELLFAVNYLAGLAHPSASAAPQEQRAGCIVNVSSLGQQAIAFDDVMLTHGYSGSRAYRQSKLAQILFTIDLARELSGSGVTVNALHPATYMNTTMVRQSGATPISSVEEGAEAILKLAVSPELEGESGLYFNGQREARADAQAYDADARRQLKALSVKLAGLSVNEYTSP